MIELPNFKNNLFCDITRAPDTAHKHGILLFFAFRDISA